MSLLQPHPLTRPVWWRLGIREGRRAGRRVLRSSAQPLEPRTMLSGAAGVFATLDATANPAAGVTIDLGGAGFRRSAGGRVLVTIVGDAANGLDPVGPITVTPVSRGDFVRILTRSALGSQSLGVAALSLGKFQVSDPTASATQLSFRLTGDVNGDFQVDGRDLRIMQTALRHKASLGTVGADDVNGDGQVSWADLQLTFRNLGARTRLRPLVVSSSLDTASDPNQDGIVVTPEVTLRGIASPGSSLQLVSRGGATVSQVGSTGKDGTFVATITVPMGDSTVYALVTDRFGQVTSVGVPVHRRDLAIDWSNALLASIRTTKGNPPASARQMAILGIAMDDAVDSIDRTYQPYFQRVPTPVGTSREAAVAAAAHEVLVALFPAQTAIFDAMLTASLADLPKDASQAEGVVLGTTVADGILALRAHDGSATTATARIGTQPGEWRPTPPGFLPPLLPGWGDVLPFAVTSATQFPIPAPPALGSPEYAAAVTEVEAIGSATSTTRTPEETDIARFWADAAGTATPPGHWFRIAGEVGAQRDNTISQNARMFALLGIALADSAITCWNEKYDFDFWRPVTAIRLADSDGNAATTADPNWLPLLTTPNFPSHSSGHSTFSAAAASVLGSIFGTDQVTFTSTSEGFNVAPRTFTSFTQAADEAGRSRVLGGIHYTFENLAGRQVGTELGQYVVANFLRPIKSS